MVSIHEIDQRLEGDYSRIPSTHRNRISHIDMHPKAYIALCLAVRSANPVAPHPTKWQGIEIKVEEHADFPCRIIYSA